MLLPLNLILLSTLPSIIFLIIHYSILFLLSLDYYCYFDTWQFSLTILPRQICLIYCKVRIHHLRFRSLSSNPPYLTTVVTTGWFLRYPTRKIFFCKKDTMLVVDATTNQRSVEPVHLFIISLILKWFIYNSIYYMTPPSRKLILSSLSNRTIWR